jgi:hypothetical protein
LEQNNTVSSGGLDGNKLTHLLAAGTTV